LLLIRGILAAFRQTIHLATCPNLPSHLYQGLKAGVEHLALAHGITRSVVVMTAFQHYLDRHGVLQEPAALVDTEGP